MKRLPRGGRRRKVGLLRLLHHHQHRDGDGSRPRHRAGDGSRPRRRAGDGSLLRLPVGVKVVFDLLTEGRLVEVGMGGILLTATATIAILSAQPDHPTIAGHLP